MNHAMSDTTDKTVECAFSYSSRIHFIYFWKFVFIADFLFHLHNEYFTL